MHETDPSKETTEVHALNKEEEDDPLLNQQGCGKVYALLEECLAENNRDWRACQKEVQAWKLCYQRAQQEQVSGISDSRK
ncbi:g3637 [Coccomyxa viridis]|uniref:G3637 protein n=1 Tax=Coccomyxa viridis TaxID=1274662 RepID=A0ABP1FV71_9CHLO